MNLPPNVLIKFPSGNWGFVGSVSVGLGYIQPNGQEATEEDYENARQVGPRLAGLIQRVWLTSMDAIEAAKELGCEITVPVQCPDGSTITARAVDSSPVEWAGTLLNDRVLHLDCLSQSERCETVRVRVRQRPLTLPETFTWRVT